MDPNQQNFDEIRSGLSEREREIFDKLRSDVDDPDPAALATAAQMMAKAEQLREEKRRIDAERKALSDRGRKAKRAYMDAHPEIKGNDKLKIGFLFINSNDPESLLDKPPQELLAMIPDVTE